MRMRVADRSCFIALAACVIFCISVVQCASSDLPSCRQQLLGPLEVTSGMALDPLTLSFSIPASVASPRLRVKLPFPAVKSQSDISLTISGCLFDESDSASALADIVDTNNIVTRASALSGRTLYPFRSNCVVEVHGLRGPESGDTEFCSVEGNYWTTFLVDVLDDNLGVAVAGQPCLQEPTLPRMVLRDHFEDISATVDVNAQVLTIRAKPNRVSSVAIPKSFVAVFSIDVFEGTNFQVEASGCVTVPGGTPMVPETPRIVSFELGSTNWNLDMCIIRITPSAGSRIVIKGGDPVWSAGMVEVSRQRGNGWRLPKELAQGLVVTPSSAIAEFQHLSSSPPLGSGAFCWSRSEKAITYGMLDGVRIKDIGELSYWTLQSSAGDAVGAHVASLRLVIAHNGVTATVSFTPSSATAGPWQKWFAIDASTATQYAEYTVQSLELVPDIMNPSSCVDSVRVGNVTFDFEEEAPNNHIAYAADGLPLSLRVEFRDVSKDSRTIRLRGCSKVTSLNKVIDMEVRYGALASVEVGQQVTDMTFSGVLTPSYMPTQSVVQLFSKGVIISGHPVGPSHSHFVLDVTGACGSFSGVQVTSMVTGTEAFFNSKPFAMLHPSPSGPCWFTVKPVDASSVSLSISPSGYVHTYSLAVADGATWEKAVIPPRLASEYGIIQKRYNSVNLYLVSPASTSAFLSPAPMDVTVSFRNSIAANGSLLVTVPRFLNVHPGSAYRIAVSGCASFPSRMVAVENASSSLCDYSFLLPVVGSISAGVLCDVRIENTVLGQLVNPPPGTAVNIGIATVDADKSVVDFSQYSLQYVPHCDGCFATTKGSSAYHTSLSTAALIFVSLVLWMIC